MARIVSVLLPASLLLIGLCAHVRAAVPETETFCSHEHLEELLAQRGVPVREVAPAPAGAYLVLGDRLAPPAAVVWFGFGRDGRLVTSHVMTGEADRQPERWKETMSGLIDALVKERTALAGCGRLLVTGNESGMLDRFTSGVMARGNVRIVDPSIPGWLPGLVNRLCLSAWVVYLLLAAVALGRTVRRNRGEASVLAGLVVVALAVRLLSSPRLPMGAAHGDMTHLAAIANWWRFGLDSFVGTDHPPAWRMLLYALFTLAGPSIDLAMLATTVAGALICVPVWLLARQAGGGVTAGIAAAAVWIGLPPAVLLSNGINLEIAGGLLLVATFVHLFELTDGGGRGAAARYLLSLLLFVQTRGEATVVGPVLIAIHLSLAYATGTLRRVMHHTWPLAIAAGMLVIPYAWQLLNFSVQPGRRVDHALFLVALFAPAALLVGLFAPFVRRAAWRLAWGRAAGMAVLALGAGAGLYLAVSGYPGNAWFPQPLVVATHPNVHFLGNPAVSHHFLPFEPSLVPPLVLLAMLAALLPPAGKTSGLLMWLPILFGYLLTRDVATGMAAMEGVRYQLPFLPLAAVLAGIGCGRIANRIGTPDSRAGRVAAVGIVALCFSPLLTHHAILTDTLHDLQSEYRFARAVIERIPDGSLLLTADHIVDLPGPDRGPRQVYHYFRNTDLYNGLAFGLRRTVFVGGIGSFTGLAEWPDSPVYFIFDQNCHRVAPPGTVDPLCRMAASASGEGIMRAVYPNKAWSGAGLGTLGPLGDEIPVSLHPLDRAAIARLREAARHLPRTETPGR